MKDDTADPVDRVQELLDRIAADRATRAQRLENSTRQTLREFRPVDPETIAHVCDRCDARRSNGMYYTVVVNTTAFVGATRAARSGGAVEICAACGEELAKFLGLAAPGAVARIRANAAARIARGGP